MGDSIVNGFSNVIYGDVWTDTNYSELNKDESVFGKTFDEKTISFYFKVKISDDFDINAIMYCGDEPSDNIYTTTVSIENSTPLLLFFENVEAKVIKKADSDIDAINLWTNITNPAYYDFPDYNSTNLDWWRTYVNNLTGISNIEDGLEIGERVSDNDILNIVTYKLNSILNVANSVAADKNQKVLNFASTGGSDPIMYTAYPEYGDITSFNTRNNKLKKFTFTKSSNAIQTDGKYPTIINDNYYTLMTDINTKKLSELGFNYSFNSILEAENDKVNGKSLLGNYVGVIDFNDDTQTYPNSIKKFTELGTYSSFANGEEKGNSLNNYLKIHTVDKRLDYDLYVINDIVKSQVTVDKDNTTLFGGIALAYTKDDNNIIGSIDATETEYVYDGLDLKLNPNLKVVKNGGCSRKYYDVSFNTEVTYEPINDVSQVTVDDLEETEKSKYEFPICKFKERKDKEQYLTYNSDNAVSFNWGFTPCSYDMEAVIEGDNVKCEVYDGDIVDGSMGISNPLSTQFNTMSDILKNRYSNVWYYHDGKKFYVHETSFKFKVLSDGITSHNVYTSAPVFIYANSITENMPYDDLAEIYQKNLRNSSTTTSVEIPDEYKEDYVTYKNNGLFIASKNNPQIKLVDDDSIRNNIVYNIKTPTNPTSDINFLLWREYIDGSFDDIRLARKVNTFTIINGVKQGDIVNSKFKNIQFGTKKNYSWGDLIQYIDNKNNNEEIIYPKDNGRKKDKKNFHTFVTVHNVDINDVAMSDGKFMMGAVIMNEPDYQYSKVYYCASENQKPYFLIPFYEDYDNNDADDGTEDNENDEIIVKNHFHKKPDIGVFIKEAESGLIYLFTQRV